MREPRDASVLEPNWNPNLTLSAKDWHRFAWVPDGEGKRDMSRVLLNDLVLRKAQAKGPRKELWDTQMDGFGVRISETGRKVFFLVYRAAGVKRRQSLGAYPACSLAEARQQAFAFKVALERGENPADSADVTSKPATPPKSFVAAVDDYLEVYASEHNRPSTQNEKRWLLRNTCGTRWRDKAVAEVKKSDVVELLDDYIKAGKASGANHILSRLRTFFRWCIERGLVEVDPCDKLRKPGKTKVRERVLSEDEIVSIWRAAAASIWPYGAIVKLLLLTGQRRNEVVGMRWAEIDREAKLWTLPKERTKNGSEHRLPLSDVALSVLETLPVLSDTLVFPARGRSATTFSGFSKCKAEIDRLSGVTDWTLHDLRRTAATGMAKLNVAPHVIEKILNHVSGTFAGVAGIYNQHDYEGEMREAMTLWAGKLNLNAVC